MIEFAIVAVIVLVVILVIYSKSNFPGQPRPPWISEAPEKRAGRIGEQRAAKIISSILREDDRLFTNIQVSFENKTAELDNVIVNKYGVFIIEVKNYNGWLIGSEDDYEWTKYHVTDAGNTYSKTVKNPIRQVKRQVHILAKYLDYYGTKVWVEGYAILLHGNSPINSKYVLSSVSEIDRAIHTFGRDRLTKRNIEEISKLLL